MTERDTQWLPGPADQGEAEILVADMRNQMSPTEMVEQRLREMLGQSPLPENQVAASSHGRRPLVGECRSAVH